MIITPHLLVGAAIGAKIKNFGLIIILGLLSHFILDKIIHWDYGNKLEKLQGEKSFMKNLFLGLLEIGLDGIVGLTILLFVLWQKGSFSDFKDPKYLLFIFTGIFFSLFPDFFLAASDCFYHKFKFSKFYIDLHTTVLHNKKHIKKPTLIGLGTEILISLIAILILLL